MQKSRSQARSSKKAGRRSARPEPVYTFAEAWSVLRSTSASRDQKGRLICMFSAALIVVLAAAVTLAEKVV